MQQIHKHHIFAFSSLNGTPILELTVMAQTAQHDPVSSLDGMPAAPPPPGVVPNFINPANQSSIMSATWITCLTVATVSVWLRMYTKFIINKSHGYEDCKPSLFLA